MKTVLECVGECSHGSRLTVGVREGAIVLTKGYQVNAKNMINNVLFHDGHNERVIVKYIKNYSLCEHHLVSFTGKVYLIRIYIPLLLKAHQQA